MLIAQRNLKIARSASDVDVNVQIRVFKPEEKDGMWLCRYEIDWPEGKKSMSTGGFDSAQSLILALLTIGTELYTSEYHESDSLTWEKPRAGYGFPVLVSMRDMLIGDDAAFF